MTRPQRFLITGGGTGGHIFPALSIAAALARAVPGCDILFVGAEGRMEMERVPAAGYRIVGLPVRGMIRPFYSLRNIAVLVAFLRSVWRVRRLLRQYAPTAVLGVGGYASAPTLFMAILRGIPYFLHEQNSYAGVANRLLARRARCIFVAYDGMARFFKGKIMLTGNPVRRPLLTLPDRTTAVETFGGDPSLPTLLVVGGSLGARTLNDSMMEGAARLAAANINVVWQTGGGYYDAVCAALADKALPKHFHYCAFLSDMATAYAAADLVVARAGAGTLSELCVVGKASLLVPSPNVAEDHQTHNARALVSAGASVLVADAAARADLLTVALSLLRDRPRLSQMAQCAKLLARPSADDDIARAVLQMLQ